GCFDEAAAIACTENRATAWQQTTHVARRKHSCACLAEQTFESVFDSDHAHSVLASRSFNDSAYHGVEAWCITAASQDTNASKHKAQSNIAECELPIRSWQSSMTGVAYQRMEIDDDAKEIVREIGTAINESVENSTKVAEAIERLREAGYEMELTLRLEIGLRPHAGDDDGAEAASLDLTEEDLQVLQRMKIRIDPEL